MTPKDLRDAIKDGKKTAKELRKNNKRIRHE